MITKQFQDPMTGELISLIPLVSVPVYIDNIIYFNGQVGDPYPYYKRYINNYVDIRWFGAIGDGVTNDSQAIIKALSFCNDSEYSILLIPDGYIFNLNGEIINVGTATLLFEGGILKNATLIGGPYPSSASAWIDAGCYKIFELDVIIEGCWDSVQGDIWVDWFGSIANDYNSVDLKDSIEALSGDRLINSEENIWGKIFKILSLNEGVYFSDKCNISVSSLKGKGVDKTNIDFRLQNDYDFGIVIGKKGGDLSERTYDNNLISDITISLGGSAGIVGVAGLVIGAVHKPLIENVKIVANSENLNFHTENDLKNFYFDIKNQYYKLNCGVLIDGDGELAIFKNLITLSQVGIYYKTKFDIINFIDYVTWCGSLGFATVFVENETGMNTSFTGSQSWCEGLFGLYAMSSNVGMNFTNWLIENLRIEQLSKIEDNRGHYIGASIYIGTQNWLNNLIIRNTMLAGTSNGIILNKVSTGFVEFDNIKQNHDNHKKIALQFELVTNSISCVSLKNFQVDGNVYTTKSIFIEDNYSIDASTRDGISGKYYGERNFVKSEVNKNIIYKQKEIIDQDNSNYISIFNSNPIAWASNQKCKKISIDILGDNYAYYCSFYYFRDKTFRMIDVSKDSLSQDEVVINNSPTIILNKFNIVIDSYLFLFNRLDENTSVYIEHQDLIF